MTGRTHRAIAATGATTAWAVGDLTVFAGLTVLAGAVLNASGPDRVEKWFGTREETRMDWKRQVEVTVRVARVKHRTWTHWLPSAFLPALLALVAVHYLTGAFVRLGTAERGAERLNEWAAAAPWAFAGGVLIGWWLHSLADATTDYGCWLILRRRVHIVPEWLRITVYNDENKPSVGDRAYRLAAVVVTCVIVGLQVASLGPTPFAGPDRGVRSEQR